MDPYPAEHDNPYFANSVEPDQMADQDLHCHAACELNEYIISSNLISG